MKKKLLSGLFAAVFAVGIAACGSDASTDTNAVEVNNETVNIEASSDIVRLDELIGTTVKDLQEPYNSKYLCGRLNPTQSNSYCVDSEGNLCFMENLGGSKDQEFDLNASYIQPQGLSSIDIPVEGRNATLIVVNDTDSVMSYSDAKIVGYAYFDLSEELTETLRKEIIAQAGVENVNKTKTYGYIDENNFLSFVIRKGNTFICCELYASLAKYCDNIPDDVALIPLELGTQAYDNTLSNIKNNDHVLEEFCMGFHTYKVLPNTEEDGLKRIIAFKIEDTNYATYGMISLPKAEDGSSLGTIAFYDGLAFLKPSDLLNLTENGEFELIESNDNYDIYIKRTSLGSTSYVFNKALDLTYTISVTDELEESEMDTRMKDVAAMANEYLESHVQLIQ